MGPIQVVVQDGNNLVLEVTPTPNTTVILDRGIPGPVGPMGDGDVDGPASSTDNAVARFDGTTGKLIQNSLVTVSDAGAVAGVTTLAASGAVTLSGGTANGVTYLNGSKVLTTGSALTFDGTTLQNSRNSNSETPLMQVTNSNSGTSAWAGFQSSNGTAVATFGTIGTGYTPYGVLSPNRQFLYSNAALALASESFIAFGAGGGVTEGMRLTSTGLGIGTSSPGYKVDAQGGPTVLRLKNSNSTDNTAIRFAGNQSNADLYLIGTNVGSNGTGANFQFYDLVAAATRLTLDSSGTLGIGTSSPANKLHVFGSARVDTNTYAAGYALTFQASAETSRTYQMGMVTGGNFAIYDSAAAAQRVVLDTSGNLGLGVTPSAWNTASYKVFEMPLGCSLFSQTDTPVFTLASNSYVDTSYVNRYKTTAAAASYRQITGQHQWFNAPSGTAGDAISFTQAMTLDASGNLGVGTTSPSTKLHTSAYAAISATIDRVGDFGDSLQFIRNGVSGSASLGLANNNTLGIYTNNTERARIDSSGNLLVGTTSGGDKLVVEQAAAASAALFKNSSGTATAQCAVAWHANTTGDNVFHQFFTETSATSRGSISYNRTAGLVAYNVTSDYRAKDIIGPVTDSGALIDSVPVYMGKMKGATQERPMFIAHEVPAYAHTGEKDAVDADGNPVYQQMDASALIPVMWAEIQSLRARLAAANI